MALGGTAKKLQKVASMAEDLYEKLNQLREQLADTRERVEETNDRIAALQQEVAEQRALVEALAEQEGVDVESVLTDAAIDEAEAEAEAEAASDDPER